MYCCPNCFTDYFLRDRINALSTKIGTCSFCKNKAVKVIDPIGLFDNFEPLLDLYKIDPLGVKLDDLIQLDWDVFYLPSIDRQRLIKCITGDKALASRKYSPIHKKDLDSIDQWENFKKELKHNNRFFPNNAPLLTDILPFGKFIGKIYKKGTLKLYRARINDSDKLIKISKMGKPLPSVVSNGRANPVGIPYLYLASNPKTAISEVKPNKGEKVTVAEFEQLGTLELADLRDPKRTISPFLLNDEIEFELIYKNMPFLTLLGNELSKPIIPREATLEYLSSQYLCELIKHIGFHGIIYKSSISRGVNYVIFNDKKLKPIKTYQYIITDIRNSAKRVSSKQ